MKAGKAKIITSVVCLVAAVAFAAVAVYAWFTTNTKARTNGFEATTTSGDISDFTVTAYQAVYKETKIDETDKTKITTEFTQGEEIEDRQMAPYTPRLSGAISSDTAIILKIETTFNANTSGEDLPLSAFLNHTDPYPDSSLSNDYIAESKDKEAYFNNFITNNYLSTVIKIKPLKLDGDIYSTDNKVNEYSFVEYVVDDNSDNIKIETNTNLDNISYPDSGGNLTDTKYFLLDYDTDYVTKLYTFMLRRFPQNANLSTKILFTPDIYFKLG